MSETAKKKSFSWIKFLKRLFIVFGIVYLVICGLLYFQQEALLFHPQPLSKENEESIENADFPVEGISIKAKDGITMRGWLVKDSGSAKKPVLVYYPGNAEEVSHMVKEKRNFPGYHLLLMNYRGYGKSEGEPSEENFFSDAIEIFEFASAHPLIDKNKIIPFGRSIGTGVAVYVSHEKKCPAVVLITPYECMASVAQEKYPYVPVKPLLKHQFDSETRAKDILTPMYCLIAEKDEIIPPHHAENLVRAWKGKVLKKIYKGFGHNEVQRNNEYYSDIVKFLQQINLQP